MKEIKNIRIIISGGGTGGHIFPALAIANKIKEKVAGAEILFVGAEGRMEMERVPNAGYEIKGLPVRGLIRKPTLKNIAILRDYLKSVKMAKNIVKEFNPDVVVGVGGYASAPLVRAAVGLGVPALLQEQNSYAGLTNKMLAKKVNSICVAYDNMGNYFPADKVINTGNPVRDLQAGDHKKAEAYEYYGLNADKPTLLLVGGSLGARTLNQSMLAGIEKLKAANCNIIWQTGNYYYENIIKETERLNLPSNIKILDFVNRMDLAYSIADLVISRAGALSISELCLLGKPSLLVPSPNVAEDHQTKNAMALVNVGAAEFVADADAKQVLIEKGLDLLTQKQELEKLAENALKLGKPNATEDIVNEVFKLLD